MSDMRIAVLGAAGRMGQALTRTLAETPGCTIAGGIETKDSPAIGQDIGAVAGLGTAGLDAAVLAAGGLAGLHRALHGGQWIPGPGAPGPDAALRIGRNHRGGAHRACRRDREGRQQNRCEKRGGEEARTISV